MYSTYRPTPPTPLQVHRYEDVRCQHTRIYVALERELFAQLAVVRKRAQAHKLTIKTHGKDTQPKRFTLKRRGVRVPDLVDLR